MAHGGAGDGWWKATSRPIWGTYQPTECRGLGKELARLVRGYRPYNSTLTRKTPLRSNKRLSRNTPLKARGRQGAERTNWERVKRQAIKRDKCCQRCGTTRNLDVHHKLPRGRRGRDELENLVTLCRMCHDWVHDHPFEAWRQGFTISDKLNAKYGERLKREA